MGRDFGGYDQIKIETWNKTKRAVQHRKINLGKMIDSYAQEAALHLSQLLQC
jgi:hypothetical protein